MIVASCILTAITFFVLTATNLWGSSFNIWGLKISVWVGAVIITVILGAIFLLCRLYEDETPNWFVTAVIIGVLVCILGGFFFTEPTKATATIQTEANQTYFRSYAPYYYLFGGNSSSGNSGSSSTISTPSGDSDDIGYVILVILVLLIVIGSFIIPHFWVSAVIALLALLWIFTIKEVSDNNTTW